MFRLRKEISLIEGNSETAADGGLDISRSQPEELTCFVDAAKKNVCDFV